MNNFRIFAYGYHVRYDSTMISEAELILDRVLREIEVEPNTFNHAATEARRHSSRPELLERMQATVADMNRLQAQLLADMAEFVGSADSHRSAVQELSLGLAVTEYQATHQIALAEALTARLPETFKAMRRGELDAFKASKIVEPTAILTDEQAREVDAVMARRIGRKNGKALRRSTNLAVAHIDPEAHARRCAERRQDRKVELIPQEDGTATLSADLPVEISTAAYTRIDAEARRRKKTDKDKTLDQLRADVFAALLLRDQYGVRVGPRAEVFVYLDFYTWLNLNTQPAEMAGHGIIPAWLANEIADGANTTLRRLITDPDTGQIISAGRHTYRPPTGLARLAYARDRECRSPHCHRPAQHCELDHVHDWAHHGTTEEKNLTALCKHHHRLKDQPGWHHKMDPGSGRLTITTPTGARYTTQPEPLHEPRTDPLPHKVSP
jgi:hypothetical protein